MLDALLGVQHRVLSVQSGDDMPSLAREIAHHFDTQGGLPGAACGMLRCRAGCWGATQWRWGLERPAAPALVAHGLAQMCSRLWTARVRRAWRLAPTSFSRPARCTPSHGEEPHHARLHVAAPAQVFHHPPACSPTLPTRTPHPTANTRTHPLSRRRHPHHDWRRRAGLHAAGHRL